MYTDNITISLPAFTENEKEELDNFSVVCVSLSCKRQCIFTFYIDFNTSYFFRTAFVIFSVTLVAYNIQNDESYLEPNYTEATIKYPLQSFLQVATYLNDSDWQDALDEGRMWFMDNEATIKDLPSLKTNSPSYRHQKTFSMSPKALKLSNLGYINEFASKYTRKKREKLKGLICNEEAERVCEKPISCNEFKKYRSYNGSCNNLQFPFGVALKPFRRILPPDYADGKC